MTSMDVIDLALLVGIALCVVCLVIWRNPRKEPSIEDADRELEFDAMEMWEKEFGHEVRPRPIPSRALPHPVAAPALGSRQMRTAPSPAVIFGNAIPIAPTQGDNIFAPRVNKPRQTAAEWQTAYRSHQSNPYNPHLTFSEYLIGMEQNPVELLQRGMVEAMLSDQLLVRDHRRYYQ